MSIIIKLHQKDSKTLKFIISDNDDTVLTKTQLDAASDIRFMVKENPTDADVDAKITKFLGSGITTLDYTTDPDGANLQVDIDSPNNDLTVPNADFKDYYAFLQVKFSVNKNSELFWEDDNETILNQLIYRVFQEGVVF